MMMGAGTTTAWELREDLQARPARLLSEGEAARTCGVEEAAQSHVNSVIDKLHGLFDANADMPQEDFFLAILGAETRSLLFQSIKRSQRLDKKAARRVQEWELFALLAQLLYITGCSRYSETEALRTLRLELDASHEPLSEAFLNQDRFDSLLRHFGSFHWLLAPAEAPAAASSTMPDLGSEQDRFSWDDLERSALAQSLALCADRHLRITFESYPRGIGSAALSTMSVKTGRLAVDATLDVKLFRTSFRPSRDLADVVADLSHRVRDDARGETAGPEICLHQTWPSYALHEMCAQLGLPLTIAHTEGGPFYTRPEYEERWLGLTGSDLANFDERFIIDSRATSPVGGQIFVARRCLATRDTSSSAIVHAFAVCKRHVVKRFACILPEDLADKLADTFVFSTRREAPSADLVATWLYYPEDGAGTFETALTSLWAARAAAEDAAELGDFVSEENNEYSFAPNLSTGSAGSADSAADLHEEMLAGGSAIQLCTRTPGSTNASNAASEDHLHSREATEEVDEAEAEDADLGEGMYLIRAVETPMRSLVETILSGNVTPLTASQGCVAWRVLSTLLLTESTAHLFAEASARCRRLLHSAAKVQDLQIPSDQATGRQLCRIWLSMERGIISLGTPGSPERLQIAHQLRSRASVDAIFDVGLVRRQTRPGLGASPDAFVIVRPPLSPSRQSRLAAPLKIAVHGRQSGDVAGAQSVAQKHGFYFACDAGSERWFEVVPTAFRSQLIHQASVFGASHGVFCVSIATAIEYVVLVRFPSGVRQAWLAALEQAEGSFVAWAYSDGIGAANVAAIPHVYEDEGRRMLASRLPMWNAFHARRVAHGVLTPVMRTRTLVEFYYDASRPLHPRTERFAPHALELGPEQQDALGLVTDVVENTFTLWGLWKASRAASAEERDRGIAHCLGATVPDSEFGVFVRSLVMGLLSRARKLRCSHDDPAARHLPALSGEQRASSTSPLPPKASTTATGRWQLSPEEHETLRLKKRQRNILKLVNTTNCKRLRLAQNVHHQETLPNPRYCVLCGKNTRLFCRFCNAALHGQRRSSVGQKVTCWARWHTEDTLEQPTPSD